MTEITWTEAGRKHAADQGLSTENVEASLRGDIERGEIHPRRLIFHTLMPIPDNDDVIFAVSPNEDGSVLTIDGAKWERGEVLDEGPFKGRAMVMAKAMTEDEG